MGTTNELVVIEHGTMSKGWYGGYKFRDGKYEQVFNVDERLLFHALKTFLSTGHTIKMLDCTHEEKLLGQTPSLQEATRYMWLATIWRNPVQSPFSFGKDEQPICTTVDIGDYDVSRLSKGFMAIVVHTGPAKGVYELESGGIVGPSISEVNKDIDACPDMQLMQSQLKDAAKRRDEIARPVSNEQFGLPEKGCRRASSGQEYQPGTKSGVTPSFANSAMEKY